MAYRSYKDFTEDDIANIIKLYEEGMSQLAIGSIYGMREKPIRRVLNENNVHIRTDREQALKYKWDDLYFDNIDTEEKAYWLGFIYADGYITRPTKYNGRKVGISLAKRDENHLYKFR